MHLNSKKATVINVLEFKTWLSCLEFNYQEGLEELPGTCASVLEEPYWWRQVKRAKFQGLETGIFILDPLLIHWMILGKLPNLSGY